MDQQENYTTIFTKVQASAVLECYGFSIDEYEKINGENYEVIKVLVFAGV